MIGGSNDRIMIEQRIESPMGPVSGSRGKSDPRVAVLIAGVRLRIGRIRLHVGRHHYLAISDWRQTRLGFHSVVKHRKRAFAG